MFLALLRTSLDPVMVDLESVWSLLWLPPSGRTIRFDRLQLTRDDWATEVATGVQAVGAGLITKEEWRVRVGLPIEPEFGEFEEIQPVPAAPGRPRLELLPGGADNDGEEDAS
jgi:hypothetical protein